MVRSSYPERREEKRMCSRASHKKPSTGNQTHRRSHNYIPWKARAGTPRIKEKERRPENPGERWGPKSQTEQARQSLGCNCSDLMGLARMSCAKQPRSQNASKDDDKRLERRKKNAAAPRPYAATIHTYPKNKPRNGYRCRSEI